MINAAQPRAHTIIRQTTGRTRLAAQACGISVDATFIITPKVIQTVTCINAEATLRRIRLERWVAQQVMRFMNSLACLN